MAIPESISVLAGFVMAHAVWSQSDLPPGEAFVPLAVTEQGSQRKLLRFNADSAQAAVEKGRAELLQMSNSSWALGYAVEEPLRSGQATFVEVAASSPAMSKPIVFRYQYQHVGGRFQLLGPPRVVSAVPTRDVERASAIAAFQKGIASHPKVGPLWKKWQAE